MDLLTVLAVFVLIAEVLFGILLVRFLISELLAILRKPKRRELPIVVDRRKLFDDDEYSELLGYLSSAEEDLEDEEE